jgi:uncharacterized membrane protein
MFDDLRSQAATPFDDDEQETAPQPTARTLKSKPAPGRLAAAPTAAPTQAGTAKKVVRRRKKALSEIPLLGLTAVQRFVVAIMMFMLVAVFGFVVLLFAGVIVLPL